LISTAGEAPAEGGFQVGGGHVRRLGLQGVDHLDAHQFAGTHHPLRAGDFRAYKVLNHQHLPEVRACMAAVGIKGELAFVPQSAPMVRGIFATAQFPLPAGIEVGALRAHYEAFYKDRFFVRVVDGSPRVAATTGSAFADLGMAARHGHAAVMVALDNLGKGMAAQAVQNLNLALGQPEWTGLKVAGASPA